MKLSLPPLPPALIALSFSTVASTGCAVPTSTGTPADEEDTVPLSTTDGTTDSAIPTTNDPTDSTIPTTDTAGTPGYQSTADAGNTNGGVGSTNEPDPVDTMALSGTQASITVHSLTVSCGAFSFPGDFGLPTDMGPLDQVATANGTQLDITATYSAVNQSVQVMVDLAEPADMGGCAVTAQISATGGPGCGLQALPFMWNGNFLAEDLGGGYFNGQAVTSVPASYTFTPTPAAGVTRIGVNIYACGPPPPV